MVDNAHPSPINVGKDSMGVHNRQTAINGPVDSWGGGGQKPQQQQQQAEVVEETRSVVTS